MLIQQGTFSSVEEKLRDLSSGNWKGKDLSQRAGTKGEKQKMAVPLLQVTVNRNVSILWQIDVGFYDELPWVQQHIVKGRSTITYRNCCSMLIIAVWQIVTSENEVCLLSYDLKDC